jgi:hypothetical protein
MTKARIIKRTHPSGRVEYVIQQRHWLFRWWWVDAWINAGHVTSCNKYSFSTLDQAKLNLWQFDGSKPVDQVVG